MSPHCPGRRALPSMCSALDVFSGPDLRQRGADVGLALGIERPEAVYIHKSTEHNLDSACCEKTPATNRFLHVAATAAFGSTTIPDRSGSARAYRTRGRSAPARAAITSRSSSTIRASPRRSTPTSPPREAVRPQPSLAVALTLAAWCHRIRRLAPATSPRRDQSGRVFARPARLLLRPSSVVSELPSYRARPVFNRRRGTMITLHEHIAYVR